MRRVPVLALTVLALFACDRPRRKPPAEAEVVAVDWLGRGQLYAAKVVDRRGGLTGVEYADGDREWVEPARLRAWPELSGRRVEAWLRGAAQAVTVLETRGSLVHVRLDDGADTWIARDMLYALDAAPPAAPGERPGETPRFPIRPGVADPATVRAGAAVLAYWPSDGAVGTSQPWLARVLSVEGGRAQLRYSDGSEATVGVEHVVRVFEAGAAPRVGERVWIDGASPVGRVIEERAGLVKVAAGAEERWIEAERLLAPVEAVDRERVGPGALVTALWGGTTLWHGTVLRVQGEEVQIAWHDGSAPSAVPVGDVVELWGAPGR